MSLKRIHSLSLPPLLAVTFLLAGSPAPSRAETNFGQVSMHVANMLQDNHYSRLHFDDTLSERVLTNYLASLDYTKRFFTQDDVDEFTSRYATTLDDEVKMQNIQPAFEIYEVYEKRVAERIAEALELLKNEEFSFDDDDTIEITRKDSSWPRDAAAAKELWRRIIKNQILQEELQRIGVEEEDAAETEAKGPGAEKKKKEEEKEEKDAGGAGEDTADADKKIRDDLIERWDRVLKGLKDNDEEEIVNYFLTSIALAYDPHSDYFSHREVDNFQISMRHSLTGIGAMLSMVDGTAEIQGLVVGGPAHKSKRLNVQDRIVGVAQGIEGEMVDIVDMNLSKVVELIRGKEGSIVRLNVIPAGLGAAEVKEVAIARDTVELKDKLANAEVIVTKDSNDEELRLGWIYLYSFYADMNGGSTSTTTDVRRLVERLMKEDIGGLVLDLRGNGGGSLEEAINLTGLFIPRGPVVQSKDWRGNVEFRRSRNRYPVYDGPLAVLTDKASASASEILAAALQDYNRALVIGEKATFGKGTVQTIMPVSRQMPIFSDKERAGALKVTIQKFYRIAGGSTQLRGVIPNIILPSRADVLDIGEESLDNPLEYDVIAPQQFYTLDEEPFPVRELMRRSSVRIDNDRDFQYILEDSARIKERIDKNVMSLNKEERLNEAEESKQRNEQRDEERRERFAKVREAEKDLFTTYKLTLDNVDETTLTLRDSFSDEESSGMILGNANKEDADKSLEYPHGFDPVKLETLNIVADFIELKRASASKTVKVTPAPAAGDSPAPQRVE